MVPDMVVQAYEFLLQPWVIYVSTFVAGSFVYEWGAQISARYDRRSPKFSWMLTKVYAGSIKSGFSSPGFSRWMLNRYDYVGALNERLEAIGLPGVPEEITNDERLNRAYAQYLGMIGDGDARLAYAFFQRVVEPLRDELRMLEAQPSQQAVESSQAPSGSEP